ncbi:MAG: helix-turn-helix domain-containing protein [Synergistaceae bacterium]|nr:helix-turn-helix domain-containing protein [Synergistaceae bacterium]MBQ9628338.1 helix-turn-helix domain-containing protein [Synergistaceae bacterium]MBR0251627.1 helix-turn-helix domain-containing protein [Synergistaceae bacterium]
MYDMYISAREIARMLNLSRGTIYTMRRKGVLPEGRRIGGVRRWSMAELQTFLNGGINA